LPWRRALVLKLNRKRCDQLASARKDTRRGLTTILGFGDPLAREHESTVQGNVMGIKCQ